MKTKFATIDLCAVIHDLTALKSMRVVNVYNINSKTFLIKLQKPNNKAFILFESGIRIHRTSFDWPKAVFPSSFSMKFRKHINQKRLTNVSQVGMDRIIDLQFGDEERICHVIVELYDRGNIILTDHEYIILNILRPRTDTDNDVRFSVKEKYPIQHALQSTFLPSIENILLFLQNANDGELLKRSLVKHIPYGSLMLDHCLILKGFPENAQVQVHIPKNIEGAEKIYEALKLADEIAESIRTTPMNGYISSTFLTLQNGNTIECYQEYYPYDFQQFHLNSEKFNIISFPTFSDAVDKFYSSIESQKIEKKIVQVENETSKRLENIKKDHEQRLKALNDVQAIQEKRGELVQYNRKLVDQALLLIRSAIASKLSWEQVSEWVEQYAKGGAPAAKSIVNLNLASNIFTMKLSDPFESIDDFLNVEIDIGLTADQNVRKYFMNRKNAIDKQQKTLAASNKALKSAQVQIKNKLNKVHIKTNSIRARKTFWFEKFYWFISSDGYLVVAGRDAQQNELLVKKYFKPGDIYVHAEIQGASSVVIKNRILAENKEIPPRTLNEAGTMAICYSVAWEAKVVVSAWWVFHEQVSRTAPTGEYLPTGSFMIRGKKNYLPTSQLQLGFGLLFRLDEESLEKRKQDAIEAETNKLKINDVTVNKIENVSNIIEIDKELDDELDNASNNDDSENEFPDVQINISDLITNKFNKNNEEDYTVINLLQPDVNKIKKTETEKYLEDKAKKQIEPPNLQTNTTTNTNGLKTISKRQKHKLEKIRKKYRDQDDEEREIRLNLLGSTGKKNKPEEASKYIIKTEKLEKPKVNESKNIILEESKEENEVEIQEEILQEEISIIDSLVSNPLFDESPLLVLAVCGPYSTMQKFKYKVKITPGTGKRGKAVKLAISLFLRDKKITEAERILIKNLSIDDRIAINVPGKVRVSAPMLLNTKGK